MLFILDWWVDYAWSHCHGYFLFSTIVPSRKNCRRVSVLFPFYIINTEKMNNYDSPHRSLTTNEIENEQFDKNMQKLRNDKCLASKVFLSKGFARHAPHERALIT